MGKCYMICVTNERVQFNVKYIYSVQSINTCLDHKENK